MLSVSSLGSASGAADYFARDDYYVSGETGERSEWGGKGAEELGLSGEVSKEQFEAILNGKLPNGQQIGDPKHRQIGTDLTFSMPKSASVLAYVGDDQRILEAHRSAVSSAMGFAEKNFAEARSYDRTKSGEPVNTGKLAYAMFEHDTSRAQDPQGHIHVVVANITQDKEGNWKTLWNNPLWKNNSVVGAAYHAAFREKLEELGYKTEITGKHGQFEISGVPGNLLNEYSTRRIEILEAAEKEGKSSPAQLDNITLSTRDSKVHDVDRPSLIESWKERARELGFYPSHLVADAKDHISQHSAVKSGLDKLSDGFSQAREAIYSTVRTIRQGQDPLVDRDAASAGSLELNTQQAVASAVRIMSEGEAAFTPAKLVHSALSIGMSGVRVEGVERRITQLVEAGKLIPGKSDRIDGRLTHLTTPEELAREQKILAAIDKGRGAATPIVDPQSVTKRLSEEAALPLNPGQMAAASLAIAGRDKIVAVQGVAGAGKSTMLAALSRVAEVEGKEVIGLAFQNKMVGDLAEGAGIKAQTVSSFVNQHIKQSNKSAGRASLANKIIIVEEASMVGNKPTADLVKIADTLGAEKLIFVGDRQQLAAIDAGKSFSLIQAAGVKTAHMNENLRARNQEMQTVAALASKGEARAAIDILGDKVKTAEHPAHAAAKQWLSLGKVDREATRIFSSGRMSRLFINGAVQEGLKKEGSLGHDQYRGEILSRSNVTSEELRYASSYKAGQVLEIVRANRDIGLKKGRYSVKGVDEKGRVILEIGSKRKRFDPGNIARDKNHGLSLSDRENIKLHKNDAIRWTANDKARGLQNSALAKILDVSKDGVTVETADKKVLELNSRDPMLARLDLAYALNMHMAQGITADKAIAAMHSSEKYLSNQRLFNVTVSRVRDDMTLFTDDKDKLARQIERTPGNKTSSLESTGKINIDNLPGNRLSISTGEAKPSQSKQVVSGETGPSESLKTDIGRGKPDPQPAAEQVRQITEKSLELKL
tara:strand:+ start:11066 stop:14050 length:2985 start_codon:yes stop_codon:yes gene_type:complete